MIKIKVNWFDDCNEEYECSHAKVCVDILRMKGITNENYKDFSNVNIPLRSVRWFTITYKSHEVD